MVTTLIVARTRILWLLLLALSLETVRGSSLAGVHHTQDISALDELVPEQGKGKVSPLHKWRSDFDNFVKMAQSEAGKAVDEFWKPKKEFLDTVKRYQKWHAAYSKLCDKRKAGESGCLEANELLLREYSKIDSELYAERREKERQRAALANEKPNEGSIEGTDYLFELLARLIDQLEPLLGRIERGDEPVPRESDKRAVDESMERLKRIALNTAQRVATGEALELGRIAAFKALAMALMAVPPVSGSPLYHVAPLIAMLGAVNMPLHVHYLMNIKTRAAISAADGLNPMPRIIQELANKLKHPKDGTTPAPC